MRRLTDLVLLRPRLVLAAFLVVCAAAAWVHIERGRWDFSYESMAPKGTPEVALFDRYRDAFEDDSAPAFIIGFSADPLITNDNLAMIERITSLQTQQCTPAFFFGSPERKTVTNVGKIICRD